MERKKDAKPSERQKALPTAVLPLRASFSSAEAIVRLFCIFFYVSGSVVVVVAAIFYAQRISDGVGVARKENWQRRWIDFRAAIDSEASDSFAFIRRRSVHSTLKCLIVNDLSASKQPVIYKFRFPGNSTDNYCGRIDNTPPVHSNRPGVAVFVNYRSNNLFSLKALNC